MTPSTQEKQQVKTAYHAGLRYLAHRARSITEMTTHLKKRGIDDSTINKVITIFEKEDLLNDAEFASLFVADRETFGPRSKYALAWELRQKGIPDSLIEDAISGIDDFRSAARAVKLKWNLWQHLSPETIKRKLMNHLKNRGFNYQVSIETFQNLNHIIETQEE